MLFLSVLKLVLVQTPNEENKNDIFWSVRVFWAKTKVTMYYDQPCEYFVLMGIQYVHLLMKERYWSH